MYLIVDGLDKIEIQECSPAIRPLKIHHMILFSYPKRCHKMSVYILWILSSLLEPNLKQPANSCVHLTCDISIPSINPLATLWSMPVCVAFSDKQRVLMHRHQGLNVRHGLCHIYMRYLYIYELFIAFCLFCCLFNIVTWWYICGVLCGKWQARESTGMFGNLMAIYYIMPQFIQNHSRFVMLMKTCMIS